MKEVALLLLVLDLHADIRVAKSGELTVTERITVQAREGAGSLARELPPGSTVVDVIRNGHPEPHVLDAVGNKARLRIGNAPLAKGRHRYQITYRSPRQIAFLDDHDELRWSIGGLEVVRMTAEVTLPASVPRRDLKVTTEHESFVRDGSAAFRSRRALSARDSMTFTMRFPKDVVAAPAIEQRARWFWDDYKGLLGVACLLLASGAVLVRLRQNAYRLPR